MYTGELSRTGGCSGPREGEGKGKWACMIGYAV